MLSTLLELFKNPDLIQDIILRYRTAIEDSYPEIRALIRKELDKVVEALVKLYRPVNYPYEVIPVPSIKFTKKPLIEWKTLQDKDVHSNEVLRLRRQCSKLGILINHQFLLKGFVLIDLDIEDQSHIEELKKEVLKRTGNVWDVETRRGFQKLFYLPGLEAVIVRYKRGEGRTDSCVFWTTIHVPELKVCLEVKSGRRFLATFPEASHYLSTVRGKLVAKKYKALSTGAKQFAYSCSVELLSAKPEDIKSFIIELLHKLNEQIARSLEKVIEIEGVDKQRYIEIERFVRETTVPNNNSCYSLSYGTLTYEEFKKIAYRIRNYLPNCVRIALFENVPRGYCYAFARLCASFLFYIVRPTKEEVEKIAIDFAERFKSFKRPKMYYWEYFGFGIKPRDNNVGFPTIFGIGREVFDILKEYAKCEQCPFSNRCIYYLLYIKGEQRGLTVREIVIELLRKYIR